MSHDLPPLHDPTSPPLSNSPRSSTSPFFPSPEPTATPTSNRLKRLSLVAKPTSLDLDREPGSARSARSPAPSTPDGGLRRPRSAIIGRSNIAYSPAVSRSISRVGTSQSEIGGRDSWEGRGGNVGRGSEEIGHRGSEEGDTVDDPQTFMDRHADLLRQIAEKERKVNELKQDLHQQETSLHQLKSRWITLVSRAARSPSSEQTPELTSTSNSLSSSSTSSSLFPIEESALTTHTRTSEQSVGIEKALSAMINQAEEYLSPEVLEGGKKFLGNLWRTVGAAANGKTPEGEEDMRLGESTREEGGEVEKKRKEGGWAPFGSSFDL
ncbi:hypothetical protein I350_00001 [Cryptococcus amylolentus CBS 6273]|uniref:Uncharacterized protein n=1 Tax=Cryptococcus amylolentus CBS 6273 TaxID=1296118 RepID=A0A1E3KE29_9TREE|nr:hypothetical protein I350_00001 [Cryptococcus amylolentus CBS 6273]